MEIFTRDVPSHVTEKQSIHFFRPYLLRYGIAVFRLNLIKKPRSVINIFILDSAQGQRFLARHGLQQNRRPPVEPIYWAGHLLKIVAGRTSNNQVQILRELEFEASQQAIIDDRAGADQQGVEKSKGQNKNRFDITSVQCGYWTYEGDHCVFAQDYHADYDGKLAIGMGSAMAVVKTPGVKRLDFPYWCCEHVVFGDHRNPYVTITNLQPPKMYLLQADHSQGISPGTIEALLKGLSGLDLDSFGQFDVDINNLVVAEKDRILSIDPKHEKVAGLCMVYSFELKDVKDLQVIRSLFKRHASMPSTSAPQLRTIHPVRKWHESLQLLTSVQLADTALFGNFPFTLRFQLEKFSRNAKLPPTVVHQMLDKIAGLREKHNDEAIVLALLRLHRELPYAGPFTEAYHFSPAHLYNCIVDNISSEAAAQLSPYEIAKKHKHVILVHKVSITPTGCLLQGPHAEPANRVLRRFKDHSDHFLRVSFVDEDASFLGHDPRSGQDNIYIGRYKHVMDNLIMIAGRSFSFLGFSHSSLRAHTCWFMARMSINGVPCHPEQIIKLLGEFSDIRIPAKCAARIGQNFTDTNRTIKLEPSMVGYLSMVTRNGRDFSDGVGTISEALLQDCLEHYGVRKALKPTVLQIRFQGAKGMVSLDKRLPGRRLMLRKNMVKFEAPTTWDLEVCGAGFQPLPMVLNRDLIKILEDLGVHHSAFFDLQNAAIDRLRAMTSSAVDTVTMLQDHHGLKNSRLVDLIAAAGTIGLQYHFDPFLTQIVEVGLVNMLQDLKYRGRIPVLKGFTLYGIMDETAYLQEGEVFIATQKGPEGGRKVHVQRKVLVSRSPARHPGDAQIVDAVDVPSDSPLQGLFNCIVFSQHGYRDLPSQLSGGDLDGDLYHVIFDETLIPDKTYPPADYPRVAAKELDRQVTAKDMSDFFVQFYKQDVLGMVCNLHTHLADILPDGTFSDLCITLANMASTAVDFSKTGLAVNVDDVRLIAKKFRGGKPHFMAPSPRIVAGLDGRAALDYDRYEPDDEDAFENLDQGIRRRTYYRSHKILGKLFDAIDEERFLKDMHDHHGQEVDVHSESLPSQILDYVRHYASQYALLYTHHDAFAENVKESYEDSLFELLDCYGPNTYTALTEIEAFSGVILGRQSGAQGKALRSSSMEMRERLRNVVDHTIVRIKHGDHNMRAVDDLEVLLDDDFPGDRELEGLARAIAVLQAAVNTPAKQDQKRVELKTLAYIAASVCLEEFQRYMITTYGRKTLPSIFSSAVPVEQAE